MAHMPSSNPRYRDYNRRISTVNALRSRVLAGEPCALCGQPIDLSLPQTYVDPRDGKRKRAPWSFEVDEIVPISQGGLPYGENCQPAHRICNQKAGPKRGWVGRGKKLILPPKPSRDW